MHLHQRGEVRCIAKVISEFSLGQGRAGSRLYGHDANIASLRKLMSQEWECDTRKVAATAGATHHDVGVGVSHLHLPLGFNTDDGLVHEHVVKHAAQRVFGVFALRCALNRLADGDPEASGAVRMFGQDGAARFSPIGWTSNTLMRRMPPSWLFGTAFAESSL